ncbi:MAG: ABC transporter permease [Sphingomonas oligoaromativorans]
MAALRRFRSPGTVIGRFVARRSVRGALGWGALLGIYTASKSLGIAKAYPTAAARAKIAHSFTGNKGLEILLGQPHRLGTISGFTAWNCVQIMLIVGSIWAFLLATKMLRGDEESGRWELLLTGSTTARRATLNAIGGLLASLTAFFVIVSAACVAIGHSSSIAIGASAMLFLTLTVTLGVTVFLLVGAFTSQIMPTRGRAASLAAGIFGVSFLLRATGDTTSAHWLLNFTPLGWAEKAAPLTGSQPLWLLPLLGLGLILAILTVDLAGRRDLGDSFFADRDSAPAHTRLLGSPLGLSLRLQRTNILSWAAGLGLLGLFYGGLTKTALQLFKSLDTSKPAVQKLLHESNLASAKSFLGFVFLIMMLIVMSYAASQAGAIRREEANGFVDNLLVRPVSRGRWFGGRALLASISVILVAVACSLGVWVGVASQHLGVSIGDLLQASLNIAAPALLAFGSGSLAFGWSPRLTSAFAYGVLVWSFLIDMLGSGLNLNHWLLDTSVMNHVALAPAVSPNWHITSLMAGIGVALMLLGAWRFSARDLQTE